MAVSCARWLDASFSHSEAVHSIVCFGFVKVVYKLKIIAGKTCGRNSVLSRTKTLVDVPAFSSFFW